jgi:hypothetical protein
LWCNCGLRVCVCVLWLSSEDTRLSRQSRFTSFMTQRAAHSLTPRSARAGRAAAAGGSKPAGARWVAVRGPRTYHIINYNYPMGRCGLLVAPAVVGGGRCGRSRLGPALQGTRCRAECESVGVVSVTVSATAASCSWSCSDALMLPSCRVPSADSHSGLGCAGPGEGCVFKTSFRSPGVRLRSLRTPSRLGSSGAARIASKTGS